MHPFISKLLSPLNKIIIPYPSAHDTNLRRLSLLHAKCTDQSPFEKEPKVTILGTSNQVGVALLRRLLAGGAQVFASRHTTAIPLTHSNLTWFSCELADQPLILPQPTSVVFSMVDITLLPQHIPQLASQHVQHIIALGSVEILSKSTSQNKKEQQRVHQLIHAERDFQRQCEQHAIAYTIIRPSMLYGYGLDYSITILDNMIKRYGFMVFFGHGRGKRAPTHADDAAIAMLQAFENPISRNRTYTIEGGEVLTVRDIALRLFRRRDKKPRVLHWNSLPKFFDLIPLESFTSESITRLERDVLFDDGQARTELGYDPRPFRLDYQ